MKKMLEWRSCQASLVSRSRLVAPPFSRASAQSRFRPVVLPSSRIFVQSCFRPVVLRLCYFRICRASARFLTTHSSSHIISHILITSIIIFIFVNLNQFQPPIPIISYNFLSPHTLKYRRYFTASPYSSLNNIYYHILHHHITHFSLIPNLSLHSPFPHPSFSSPSCPLPYPSPYQPYRRHRRFL